MVEAMHLQSRGVNTNEMIRTPHIILSMSMSFDEKHSLSKFQVLMCNVCDDTTSDIQQSKTWIEEMREILRLGKIGNAHVHLNERCFLAVRPNARIA